MDRSAAATTLLLWQLEGHQELLRAAGTDGDRTLLSLVESVAPPEPPRRPHPLRPVPEGFLHLEEEREVGSLRDRLRALLPVLTPDERQTLEASLRPGLMPRGRIERLRGEFERLGGRELHRGLQSDFENWISRAPSSDAAARASPQAPTSSPEPLRALLLFARNGRLIASEGNASSLDVAALSQLIARGDAGNTWSLTHRTGSVVGHLGQRAALVAVFSRRPKSNVGGTLRVSVLSLEQRERLLNSMNQPGSHEPLMAYLRAVRVLLRRST